VAQTPEGQRRAAAASPLTSEEALQQARSEGLTLLLANTKTGYFGVNLDESRKSKPFGARVPRLTLTLTLTLTLILTLTLTLC
jgi:hypothetical protein